MSLALEILYAFAALATIADLGVSLWKEHERRRMTKGR